MTDLAPGLYRDIPYRVYEGWEGLRSHEINGYSKTPAHAFHGMTAKREETPAMRLGRAIHTCILEPKVFAAEYVVPPKLDKRFKDQKAEWEQFLESHKGKTFISHEEYIKVKAMAGSVMDHPLAAELVEAGEPELSMLWDDGATGLRCKGRMDLRTRLGDQRIILDLKSAMDADGRELAKSIHKYGYHRQLAFYRSGAMQLKPDDYICVLLVVENEPPHCARLVQVDERALLQGAAENASFLRIHQECVERGSFPGYDQGVTLIDLPPYARVDLTLNERQAA